MDWPKAAIEMNRDALIGVVATLFAMLGLAGDAVIGRIPRPLHSTILRVLRPAEAALRRLIYVMARDVKLKPRADNAKPVGKIEKTGKGTGKPRRPLFRIDDPRPPVEPGPKPKRYRKSTGVHVYPYTTLIRQPGSEKPVPLKDGKIDGNRLARRLRAIMDALRNLDREARRCARWQQRRRKINETRAIHIIPIRPGPPPYSRKKSRHEVDDILRSCHDMAWEVRGYDTS
jgi:hypothetical protein